MNACGLEEALRDGKGRPSEGCVTVLCQKTEHVIGRHGSANVSEAMASSFVSVF